MQDASPDGHHVLDGTANFYTYRIRACVQPESGPGKRLLNAFR